MKKVIPKGVQHRKIQTPLVHNTLTWQLSEWFGINTASHPNKALPKNRDLPICDIKIKENLYMYVVYPNTLSLKSIDQSVLSACNGIYVQGIKC